MRAPSTDLLRALRRATTASPGLPLLRPTNPSSRRAQQHPLAIGFTRGQTCSSVPQSSSSTRHAARALSTSRQAPSSSSSASSTSNPSTSSSTSRARPQRQINPRAPRNHDRGPVSKEPTQTDFAKMDILASAGVEEPATSIDACTGDGFHLNNGVHTSGGKGIMLVAGEAFVWQPWLYTNSSTTDTPTSKTSPSPSTAGRGGAGDHSQGFTAFLDARGLLNFPPSTLGLLALLYPKPDLLLLGTGRRLWMLSRDTRRYLSEELGIKVDVMDTPNAAAAYNLLVMERGVEEVGAILVPEGWAGR
ncbi:hypothetical protein AYL99_09405 [Fonsecaea erecta]|uniref:NADH dehydrogenase [ubiquinone] 1 alpha subcomplex assembly factor 3 n=1 Tax=Fonsecaea erecta TaxID=1367422 RepID=A0A178Z9T0_9EURO|nr:hypothetical protein AYL99_09405 [Fonsecaea erecta]OAP56226.1 hypothetical protein AYL99_09405 [Fonsecaea erecta]